MLRAEIEQVKELARQIAVEETAGLKKELAGLTAKIGELDQKIQQVAAVSKPAAAEPAVKGA